MILKPNSQTRVRSLAMFKCDRTTDRSPVVKPECDRLRWSKTIALQILVKQEKVQEAIALLISQPVVKQDCDRLRWSKAIARPPGGHCPQK